MSEQPETRRQNLLIAAVDPGSGKPTTVQISHDKLMVISGRSMGHALEMYNVLHVLQKPTAIFEGLREEEDEDRRGVGWRCYCGIPLHSYRLDGTEAPPYREQVYLVFVNQERMAYNWRWEKSDCINSELPIGYRTRFTRRLL